VRLIDADALKARFAKNQYYSAEAICEKCDNAPTVGTRWIPFKKRPLDEEECESHPGWVFVFDCPLPDDGQEILVSNGRWVWKDDWSNDAGDCGLESGDEIEEGWAWMPLPEPPEEDKA
jgi:hypothetical protein